MSNISSAPQRVSLKFSGLNPSSQGFSLVEVVVAVGIISFALISILGVMTISMTVHQDASIDSVFSIMTESAVQEVRNYNAPAVNLASGPLYSFGKLTGYTGYIYFDEDGQITMDQYRTTATTAQSSAAVQSTDLGILMSPPALNPANANASNASVPLTTAMASGWPAGTYYTCTITTAQPTLSTGATTPSMYLIKLTFTWPPGITGAALAAHTRIILSSISNNTN
jgi:Tfp pilus assembly protein PilV